MSYHIFALITYIVFPVILSGLFVWLKRKYLIPRDKYEDLNTFIGEPLLMFLALLLSSLILQPLVNHEHESIDFVLGIYQLLLVILLLVQMYLYIKLIRQYYKSRDEIPEYMNWVFLILFLILFSILLAVIEIEVGFFLLQIIFFLLGIAISIFVIATGVGLSTTVNNYIHQRKLAKYNLLENNKYVTINCSPKIEGEVVQIQRDLVVIETADSRHYINPSQMFHYGFSVSLKNSK